MKAWEVDVTLPGPKCTLGAPCGESARYILELRVTGVVPACESHAAMHDEKGHVVRATRIHPRDQRRAGTIIVYAKTANEATTRAAHWGYEAGAARPYVPIVSKVVENYRRAHA